MIRGICVNKHDRIMSKTNGTCVYCGELATEIDHVLPRAYRVINNDSNLVPSCSVCNKIASAQVFESLFAKQEYILHERQKPRWKRRLDARPPQVSNWALPKTKVTKPKSVKIKREPVRRHVRPCSSFKSQAKPKELSKKAEPIVKPAATRKTPGYLAVELAILMIRLYDKGERCMAEILEVYNAEKQNR